MNPHSTKSASGKTRETPKDAPIPFKPGTLLTLQNQNNVPLDWYKVIMQNAVEGIVLVDSSDKILDVNDAYCRMLGYSRDDLLNMNSQDIYVASGNSYKRGSRRFLKSIKETGRTSVEVHQKRKDGKIIKVSINVSYIGPSPRKPGRP